MKKCLLLFVFGLVLASCGVQTDTQDTFEKVVLQKEGVDGVNPTKLIISDGSANGSSVSFPTDALSEGSEVSLDRVKSPEAFTSLSNSNGEPILSASSAVEITASDSSGKAVTKLASPMTISLPYDDLALNLIADVNPDNLCILLSSDIGLYVWRRSSLDVAEEEKSLSFKSLNLGIFQAVYCGDDQLENFIEASEVAIDEGLAEISLSVSKEKYAHGATSLCLSLFSHDKDDFDYTGLKVIENKRKDFDADLVEFKLEIPLASLSDDKNYFATVLTLKEGQECSYSKGDTLSERPTVDRLYMFPFKKSNLENNVLKAALGEGLFKLFDHKLAIGSPVDGLEHKGRTQDFSLCLRDQSSEGARVEINIENYEEASWEIGLLEEKDFLSVQVGVSCLEDASASFNAFSEPYTLNVKLASDEVFYLFPTSFQLNSSLVASGVSFCLELFSGNEMTATDIEVTNSYLKRRSMWALKAGSSYELFFPWDETVVQDGIPVYDMLIETNSDCLESDDDSTRTKVPVNDKKFSPDLNL